MGFGTFGFGDINDSEDATVQDAIITIMNTLTDNERLAIIDIFCRHCGSQDPSCQCWNDE